MLSKPPYHCMIGSMFYLDSQVGVLDQAGTLLLDSCNNIMVKLHTHTGYATYASWTTATLDAS